MSVIKKAPLAAALVAVLAAASSDLVSQSATVSLENFEAASIRVINPAGTTPSDTLLFNQYEGDFTEGPDPGVESISVETARDGNRSLKVQVTQGKNGAGTTTGNLYASFYPNNGAIWRFMRELTQDAWTLNTYTRMRLWIRVPSQVGNGSSTAGNFNLQWATYYREPNGDATSAESGGNHFYHHFNIPFTGRWHQVIMDTHPSHIRGGDGNIEWGDRRYPINGLTTHNYFDLMTRWYLDLQGRLGTFPADFYIDDIELVNEGNDALQNTTQVYSLHGVYVPATNRVLVGWSRHKDQNTTSHQVRYAFSDIFALGFDNATLAPGGNVLPPNTGGYNGMSYSTTGIDVAGQSNIYVAIRPQGATTFRQIVIPLGETDTAVPSAPGSLTIVP